jgi:hypothetical protein
MNKIELIEVIKKLVSGMDKSSSISPPMMAKYISLAWTELMYNTFKKVPNELDLYAKPYYNETISDNRLLLPVNIVQLPNMAYVRSIVVGGKQAVYQPIGFMNIEDSLEVGIIDGSISYTVNNSYVVFKGLSGESSADLYLIPDFDSYEPEDNINIPSGKSMTLAETVYNLTINYKRDNQLSNNNEQLQS